MALQKDLREFLLSLNSNKVEYLIVGAYAVAHYGHPRLTGDIDFFVGCDLANANRVSDAIASFSEGHLQVNASDLTLPEKMLRIGVEPNRVDLLTSITGVDFGDAWHRRVAGELDGVPVYFIALADLLNNKRATGRLKDAADVEELEP